MWTPSPGVVSYYIVYVNGSERARTSNGSTTSLTVSSLSPFTLYLVEVSAVNDGGEGDRSLGTSFTTLEDCECVCVSVCVCGGGGGGGCVCVCYMYIKPHKLIVEMFYITPSGMVKRVFASYVSHCFRLTSFLC